MHRLVDAPGGQIIAKTPRQFGGEGHLRRFVKDTFQHRRRFGLADGGAQFGEFWPQRAKQGFEVRRRGAGLVIL